MIASSDASCSLGFGLPVADIPVVVPGEPGLIAIGSRSGWASSLAAPMVVGAASEEAQPLTRADCDQARLAWDDNRNVCDWQAERPNEQLA